MIGVLQDFYGTLFNLRGDEIMKKVSFNVLGTFI